MTTMITRIQAIVDAKDHTKIANQGFSLFILISYLIKNSICLNLWLIFWMYYERYFNIRIIMLK